MLFAKTFSLCEDFLQGTFLGKLPAHAIERSFPLFCEPRFRPGVCWLVLDGLTTVVKETCSNSKLKNKTELGTLCRAFG